MPPTFAYVMCLVGYLALMAVSLVLCAPLFLVPSKRRLALRLWCAIIASLPGILAFQFIVGPILGGLLLAVLALCSAFHYPDWMEWIVGIPTILIIFASFATASFWGCYTGGRIGWEIAGGKPFMEAVREQKIAQLVVSWFRKNKA